MGLGTIMPHEDEYVAPEVFRTEFIDYEAIPESFDVRENWPECAPITGHVRDQSNCGSCWAFAATACIESHHFLYSGELLNLAEQ